MSLQCPSKFLFTKTLTWDIKNTDKIFESVNKLFKPMSVTRIQWWRGTGEVISQLSSNVVWTPSGQLARGVFHLWDALNFTADIKK